METINRIVGRAAESISPTGRVGLDGQIKRVFPHELKMTETKPMFSVSMYLPLTFDRASPKGTLSSDRLARRGARALAGQRRAHPSFTFYNQRGRRNNSGGFPFCPTAAAFLLIKPSLVLNRATLSRSQRQQTRPSATRIQLFKPPAASPALKS